MPLLPATTPRVFSYCSSSLGLRGLRPSSGGEVNTLAGSPRAIAQAVLPACGALGPAGKRLVFL